MRLVFHDPAPSPTARGRWHVPFEEPCPESELEVDFGDCRIWRGVRYAPHLESFIDEETGATVAVAMWRYAKPQ